LAISANGEIGNMGAHETGIARRALGDPGWPKTAMAFGGQFGIFSAIWPTSAIASAAP
jgi:hypothetical protein